MCSSEKQSDNKLSNGACAVAQRSSLLRASPSSPSTQQPLKTVLEKEKKGRKKKKDTSAVTMEADSGAECIIARRYGLRPFADVVALIMIRYCARLISAAVSHVNHLFPYIIITSLLIPSLAGITSSPFYLDCWHFSSVVCSVNMQNKDKEETSRSLNCLERVLQISVQ